MRLLSKSKLTSLFKVNVRVQLQAYLLPTMWDWKPVFSDQRNRLFPPSPSEKYKQDKKEEYTESRHIEESTPALISSITTLRGF